MNGAHTEPSRRTRERGGALLKAMVWLLILAGGGYVAYKVVPAYMSDYELQDKMRSDARFAAVNHRSDEELRDLLYRDIQDLNIPARRQDIQVLENSGHAVRLGVDYTVTVDLKVYQLRLHFTPTAESPVV
jgi:hypothetical protein